MLYKNLPFLRKYNNFFRVFDVLLFYLIESPLHDAIIVSVVPLANHKKCMMM